MSHNARSVEEPEANNDWETSEGVIHMDARIERVSV